MGITSIGEVFEISDYYFYKKIEKFQTVNTFNFFFLNYYYEVNQLKTPDCKFSNNVVKYFRNNHYLFLL